MCLELKVEKHGSGHLFAAVFCLAVKNNVSKHFFVKGFNFPLVYKPKIN